MISEESDRERDSKNLLWAVLASVLIHALVLPAAFWSWSRSVAQSAQPRQREWVVSSTAIRIEKRTVPMPRAVPVPRHQPVPPQPQALPVTPAQAAPSARAEVAKPAPTAPPQAESKREGTAASFEQQLAQQQQNFSQEVARLRAQNNPLSIAQKTQSQPETYRRTYFDVPGHQERNVVQALLFPLRHWYASGQSCYYVRYVAQFSKGGSEDGVIPWPVCYPANDDIMANPPYPHDLPIPVPQRDYVLPSGTYLTPLLKSIYDRRS